MAPKAALTGKEIQEVLQLGRSPEWTIEKLAARFSCGASVICVTLRAHGINRDTRIKKEEKRIIREMTERGETQKTIAKKLERSRSFVQMWQRRLGLNAKPKLTPEVQKHILALARAGLGQFPIARKTGISHKKIRALMHANGICHRTGGAWRRFELPQEKYLKFVQAVFSGRYYCKDLARMFKISKHNSIKLVKQIKRIGDAPLRRGALWPPLTSDFVEEHASLTTADYMKFISSVFSSGVPWHVPDSVLVAAAVSALMAKFWFWKAAPAQVIDCLSVKFGEALGMLRSQQEANWVH